MILFNCFISLDVVAKHVENISHISNFGCMASGKVFQLNNRFLFPDALSDVLNTSLGKRKYIFNCYAFSNIYINCVRTGQPLLDVVFTMSREINSTNEEKTRSVEHLSLDAPFFDVLLYIKRILISCSVFLFFLYTYSTNIL